MIYHDVAQGTPQWHALRARHYTSSEAAAMMLVSPYETREDLLTRKAKGETQRPGGNQWLYDQGHTAEARARIVAEEMLGEELYPATISAEINGLPLLASMDGLTVDGEVGWEHKLYSKRVAEALASQGEPPIHHVWQLEHQMLVTGCKKILYMLSAQGVDPIWRWYESKPERAQALIDGWRQFHAELHDPARVLVEHEATIRDFLSSRQWRKGEEPRVRAILAEFLKHMHKG